MKTGLGDFLLQVNHIARLPKPDFLYGLKDLKKGRYCRQHFFFVIIVMHQPVLQKVIFAT